MHRHWLNWTNQTQNSPLGWDINGFIIYGQYYTPCMYRTSELEVVIGWPVARQNVPFNYLLQSFWQSQFLSHQMERHVYCMTVVSVSWHNKNPKMLDGLVQSEHHHHLIKFNLISPWKITVLVLNNSLVMNIAKILFTWC